MHIVFETLNFLRSTDSDQLNASEKLLLVFLAAHQGRCGIFPSTQILAKEMKVSVRYITILLTSLVQKKIIKREQSAGEVNTYSLLFSQTPEQQFGSNEVDTPELQFTPPPNTCSGYLRTIVQGSLYIYITNLITELITQTKKPVLVEEKVLLPEWLPIPVWESFIEHRKEIKAPMSIRAQRLMMGQLQKLRMEGTDIVESLNQSIMNGWKGVFPVRQTNGQAKESYLDKIKRAVEERANRHAHGSSFCEIPSYLAGGLDAKH